MSVSTETRVLIVGGGAIGGVVAGELAASSAYPVTVVDVDDAHLEAVAREGLTTEGPRGTRTVQVAAMRPERVSGTFNVVILAVKSQHTRTCAEQIRPLLAPEGVVLSLQNGINETLLSELLGSERVLGGVIHLAADLMRPGYVVRHAEGEFLIGELDGRDTPRCRMVRDLLAIAAPTTMTDNIWGWLWTKQIYACLLVASALADEPIPEQLAVPHARAVHAALLAEATRVALAEDIKIEPLDVLDPRDMLEPERDGGARVSRALNRIASMSQKGHSGMWRDIRMKGRKSESDEITGYVVARGVQLGILTPVNAAVHDTIHRIENGQQTMSLENFRPIADLAREWLPHVGTLDAAEQRIHN